MKKVKGLNGLIKLNKSEVKTLLKKNKHCRLVRTCRWYYVCNDDYDALKTIAQMRGYDYECFYNKCVNGLTYT